VHRNGWKMATESHNGCIASGNVGGGGEVDCADHGQGIKFRVATSSGINFQGGTESFWNSIRDTGVEY
jgi:hypothetical protein